VRTDYLAECLWPGVTEADLADIDVRAKAAADPSRAVHYVGSVLVPADGVVFCFFEGPSAALVESVARSAAIPFDRVLELVRVGAHPARASARRSAK